MKRAPRLKVFGGNLDGRLRAIMAAPSQKAFMAATGIGRDWFSETGNEEETAQAMSSPGTVFIRPILSWDGPWQTWDRLRR